jgi:hypothetical protein
VDIDTIDVFVFGFQEIVKLNADQILNTDTTNAKRWADAILNHLNSKRQRKVIDNQNRESSLKIKLPNFKVYYYRPARR